MFVIYFSYVFHMFFICKIPSSASARTNLPTNLEDNLTRFPDSDSGVIKTTYIVASEREDVCLMKRCLFK